jgi:predicted ATPase
VPFDSAACADDVEDIHWIDPSSRELLDRTIQRIADWPVLLLATFRPEFQPPWTGQPHVTMAVLQRLDRRDTAAMVANIAGNHALPTETVQEIAERTDSVPLFVEELTKAVLESGAQGVAALSAVQHAPLSVPASLYASLIARLDRLGPDAKDVAQTSAAIGREFAHELLASIADLPEPLLREALDRLTNSGLLLVRGTPPELTYLFKHALVQDAAYATLLRGRRQELHRRIAKAVEAFPERSEAQPDLLAHHFSEAGLMEPAVDYWLKAGQQALARSAMAEAEALLRRGLGLLASLPDSPRRREQELDLQTALGPILTAVQSPGATAVFDAFARARQLCDEMNRPENCCLSCLDNGCINTSAAIWTRHNSTLRRYGSSAK